MIEYTMSQFANKDDMIFAMRAEITTLRNRVRELEEIRQWRPIDTAPKDNKPYLFYRNGDIRTAFRKGNNWGSRGIGWQYEFDENVKNGFTENLPTHWKPLPEPPKEKP